LSAAACRRRLQPRPSTCLISRARGCRREMMSHHDPRHSRPRTPARSHHVSTGWPVRLRPDQQVCPSARTSAGAAGTPRGPLLLRPGQGADLAAGTGSRPVAWPAREREQSPVTSSVGMPRRRPRPQGRAETRSSPAMRWHLPFADGVSTRSRSPSACAMFGDDSSERLRELARSPPGGRFRCASSSSRCGSRFAFLYLNYLAGPPFIARRVSSNPRGPPYPGPRPSGRGHRRPRSRPIAACGWTRVRWAQPHKGICAASPQHDGVLPDWIREQSSCPIGSIVSRAEESHMSFED